MRVGPRGWGQCPRGNPRGQSVLFPPLTAQDVSICNPEKGSPSPDLNLAASRDVRNVSVASQPPGL